jgi:hypothetical protein
MSDDVRINGNMYSWASVVLKVDGERFFGITSISYADALERVKGYGMGRHHAPRGRSAGKYTIEAVTVKMEKKSSRDLRAALAARATDGRSFGTVEFEIVVQYAEGTAAHTDTIERCRWAKTSASHEEAPDPLYDEVEFDAMAIRWDGKTLFDSSEEGT